VEVEALMAVVAVLADLELAQGLELPLVVNTPLRLALVALENH
jgi:hypothetical protein